MLKNEEKLLIENKRNIKKDLRIHEIEEEEKNVNSI